MAGIPPTGGSPDAVGLRGAVRGRWLRSGGQEHPLPWTANLICFSGLDLVGALLCNRPGMTGLTYFAVGSGDPAWDGAPPPPDRSRTALTAEVARVALVPGRHLVYDKPAGAVRIRITFEPGDVSGPLRELGLFGGDASARPGSGLLFNHKVHDLIQMGATDSLEREIALQLGAGLLPGARELIGLLLARQPGVAGLQFAALGSDRRVTGPPATALKAETVRLPLPPAAAVYDSGKHAVTVTVRVGFTDGPATVAEAGLFGGSATAAANSGLLVDRQVFPPLDRTKPTVIERRFVLSLVAPGTVTVPTVTNRPEAEARAVLGRAGLLTGKVTIKAVAGKPAGTVVTQAPAAGAKVAEGTAVALAVAPDKLVAVPAVVGRPVAEAIAAITSVGLVVAAPTALEESDAPPGTIVDVVPPAGEEVPEGTAVALTEASARQRIVPDVRGRTPAAAAVVLEAAGFGLGPKPYATKETGTTAGTILEQDPRGGMLAPVNRPVRITVAGPRTVVVPDLVGATLDVAISRLAAAAAALLDRLGLPPDPPGLALGGRESRPAAPGETVGTIVAQDPIKGRRAPLYGTVAVTVAGPPQNVVPNLTGLNQGAAAASLSAAGFALGAIARRASETTTGTVVAQDPAPGRPWPPGGRVALTLAVPVQVPVPDLAGLEQPAAVEAILSRRLVLGQVTTMLSDAATRAGAVIGQAPPAGQLADQGSAVDLILALGVPNVIGMALPEAIATLSRVGLSVASTEEESDLTPGRVVAQDPAPGSAASPGQAIQLIVAKERSFAVPNVVGQELGDAREVMASVGLELQVVGRREGDEPEGTVVSIDPAAGTRVNRGVIVRAIVAVARPQLVAVPEVRGLGAAQARDVCSRSSLKLTVEATRPAALEPGTVLEQDPLPQTMVPVGSEVGVTVASADNSVAVPEVRGLLLADARVVANRSGLALAVGEQRLSTERNDLVLSQSPLPGTRIPVGATVTVVASVAAIRLPNFFGAYWEWASAELESMGLVARTVRRLDDFNDPGTVVDQEPAAGTLLKAGSVVTLVVAFSKFIDEDPRFPDRQPM